MKRILIICLLIPFMTAAMFAVDIVYPTGLTIMGYSAPVLEGNTLQLQAVPTPSNTTYKAYIWSSSNTSVATVDKNGLVKAVAPGTAQIKCLLTVNEQNFFAAPNEQTATCTITVNENTEKAITFADAEVKRICVENWDTNNDGELSLSEAAVVTDLGQVFKGNSVITSFEELQYFTGLTTISECAFQTCTNLSSILFPTTIKRIERNAFENCGQLQQIELHEGLERIDVAAFSSCKLLTAIVIPSTLTKLGYSNDGYQFNPFSHCSSLAEISVASGNTVYDSRNNCNAVIESETNTLVAGCNSSTIPDDIVTLGNVSFAGYKSITSITLPPSVKTLGNQVFIDCSSLTSIDLGQVESIGYACFSAPLISVHVPATVKQIDWSNPFADSYSTIETITVDENNPYYDSHDNCNAVIAKNFENSVLRDGKKAVNVLVSGCKNTVIPSSVRAIGNMAFKYCKMSTIEIPEGVESILYAAFLRSEIQSITLPKTLSFLDENAFYSCNSLTSVTVQNTEPLPITEGTFTNRTNAILYVPKGCKEAYMTAEYWKDFKVIDEMGDEESITDISQLTDAIYVKPFTSCKGGKRTVEVFLKNAQAATAYVFDLVLPNGIIVATDSNDKYIDALSDRHGNHISAFNYKGNNTYGLAALSRNCEELTGNDDAVRLLTLHVADDLDEGTYAINIKNASYSKPDGSLVELENTTTSITLMDYIWGDVNGDLVVDVADAVAIVNHMVGKPTPVFIPCAADVNGDGVVNIADAIIIVNYLVGKVDALSRSAERVGDIRIPD